ncbi:protein TANC2 isoform X1 [Tachysurus ichikawai]
MKKMDGTTLTSYSEPADRSAKHGEGTRASSLKLWHSQRATLDSGLYRLDENMAASTHSLNKIPEPSFTHHSTHPTPLYLMPRPNSVAGESIPQARFPFTDRVRRLHSSIRPSLRVRGRYGG